jgi:hypothetical protein
VRLKGHAVRLGIDIAHLETVAIPPPPPALSSAQPKPSHLRDAAEPFAAAWFAARGFQVAVPSQPSSYDLLVTFAEGIRRIQVKSTTFRGKHGTWTVAIGQRPYESETTKQRTSYDPDALDYFFVIDGDYSVYLIPKEVVAGRLAINVGAYASYRVGDASSLFAEGRPSTMTAS